MPITMDSVGYCNTNVRVCHICLTEQNITRSWSSL